MTGTAGIHTVESLAMTDGQTTISHQLGAKTIPCSFAVKCVGNVEWLKRRLEKDFTPKLEGVLTVITPFLRYEIDCYPQNVPTFKMAENDCVYRFDVDFTADYNGLRVTVNEDKSITINGTASANSRFYIKNNVHTVNNSSLQELSNGTYIISGSPEGSSDGTYSLSYTYKKTSTTTSNTLIVPAGEEVTIDNTSSVYHLFAAFISVSSGTTLNNVTFKPMLRASGTTADYVPFEKSVTIPLDSQLFIGDYVSMADTGITVPLFVGTNNLTVGASVQPKIQIAYER